MNNVKESNKSKRGFERFTSNPFLPAASENTKTGVKRITGSQKDRMMVINQNTGEVVSGGVGFWHCKEVDRSQFLKLYINGVKAISGLSAAGTKVFEILYRTMQEHKDKDQIYLSFNSINQDITKISRATFSRGVTDLIKNKFIAESQIPSLYFINPDFIFNGDRLSFVNEYILKGSKENSGTACINNNKGE
ncbi:replication/maintenance protein RepL [Atlantibacter hermannii]|uniref:replication/maintenance protein RepL n=1 Tax=Atlantibacter hermannii TaxID=565 RepID=UPI00289762AD|nr:replication/maintenance protein RepL [Atlantibacter hermannii]